MLVVLKIASKSHQYNIEEAFIRWVESRSPFKENISDWLSKDFNGNVVRDPNRKMADLLDDLKEAKNNIPKAELEKLFKIQGELDSLNSGKFTNLNNAIDSLDDDFNKRAKEIVKVKEKELEKAKTDEEIKIIEKDLPELEEFLPEEKEVLKKEIFEKEEDIDVSRRTAILEAISVDELTDILKEVPSKERKGLRKTAVDRVKFLKSRGRIGEEEVLPSRI